MRTALPRRLASAAVAATGVMGLAITRRSAVSASASQTPGKVRVRVRDAGGQVHDSQYSTGVTLMEAIRDDPTTLADMQGSCDGKMECSTCHIYLKGEWAARVQECVPLTEQEQDTLDRALDAEGNSRLACRIILSEELDGLEVAMPAATRDARFEQFLDRSLAGQQKGGSS